MKVALPYASDFQDISPGGIQAFIVRTLSHLPSDFELTLIGIGDRPSNIGKDVNWISLFDVGQANRKNLHFYFGKNLKMHFKENCDYDLVIHHRPETMILTNSRGINLLVLHSPTWGPLRTRGVVKGLLLVLFEFLAALKATKVLTVNLDSTSLMTKFLSKAIIETPIPISGAFFTDVVPPESETLIYVGRLEKGKGVDKLLVLAKKNDRKIVVVGDGSEGNKLKEMAEFIKVEAEFTGYLSSEEILHLYKLGGVVMSASSSEGLPISLLEAMASKLPLIILSKGKWVDKLVQLGACVQSQKTFSFEDMSFLHKSKSEIIKNIYHETPASISFWNSCKVAGMKGKKY
jgi:glycosyltransferase involved in cell wall biosynthesis